MNTRMESLDVLVRQVLPSVLSCPRGMALDALRAVARDFCSQAAVWRERLETTVLPGESDVELVCPSGAHVALVLGVWLDGRRLETTAFSVEGDRLCFTVTFPRACGVIADAALRPGRFSEAMPSAILEEWGDILTYGAVAKLQSMSGQHVTWANPSGAGLALEQYNEGVARARIRAMRVK